MKKKPSTADTKVEQFVEAAEQPTQEGKHPWQQADSDKIKIFNLKIPESYHAKLDYLMQEAVPKKSKQFVILELLLPAIDEELKKRDLPV